MDEFDTFSMTPPLSPTVVFQEDSMEQKESSPENEDVDHEQPSCFACMGEATSSNQRTHLQSYLQRGALERLTSDKLLGNQDFDFPTISLFGRQFDSQLAMDQSMDTLFYLCRQHIAKIEDEATPANNLFALRVSVRRFFEYINKFCQRHESSHNDSSNTFLLRLIRHLQDLMIFMGEISDLPKQVLVACGSKQGNQSLLRSYHLFHLHLDVMWSTIELLHQLTMKYPDYFNSVQLVNSQEDGIFDNDIFSQYTRICMWDLVRLSMDTFNKMPANAYQRQTPFVCSCVKELLVLLIKLLNYRHEKRAKQSFWVSLFPILQHILSKNNATSIQETKEIDTDKYDVPPDFECSDGVGFCWWLLVHYAPLYQYDRFGVPRKGKLEDPSKKTYSTLHTLLKRMLSKRLNEAQFRCYLRCCLAISELWGPNSETVSLLWEHFYKRLNEPFRQACFGIEGFTSANKTPSVWLDQCRKLVNGDKSKLETDTSYHLFLIILSTHIQPSMGGKVNTTWDKLKGRFYTKFHARRMQELTEAGLINFTTLFLTLALSTQAEDVASTLCDLYALVSARDVARRDTIWKGQFAAIMLMTDSSKDPGFVMQQLGQDFNNICSEASTVGLEPARYTELFGLINLYLDYSQDVIESSPSLNLNYHELLGTRLGCLLRTCRANEMQSILSFTQAILSKVRQVVQRADDDTPPSLQIRRLTDAFWTQVYTFVKTHATTETPPPQLADVAANFSLLVVKSRPGIETGMKEDFMGVFKYFGWNERVSARMSCRFLNHLLPTQSVVDCLAEELTTGCETQLIAAWFRCAWQLPTDNPQMAELTRLMMKLRPMRDIFEDAGMDPDLGDESAVEAFIMAIGGKYSGLTDLGEKSNYRTGVNTMLGDVVKRIITSQRPGATVAVTFKLGGLLAKYCAQILYVKSNARCIFPELIERLALPRILLNPNKPVPALLLSAIKDNLHLFMHGLSRLDFRRDPYIQRKTKEIVSQYLLRFPMITSISLNVSTVHPLLPSLEESCSSNPKEETVLFRQHVLKVMRDEFLTSPGSSTNVITSLTFISALLERTRNGSVIARDCEIVLRPVLNGMLEGQTQAANCMQRLMEACAKLSENPYRVNVSQVVDLFTTQQMGAYQGRVMKVLEAVSVIYPAAIIPSIPVLSGAVRSSEAKRGVGVDKQLRVLYFAVLNNLGEEGQAEKSALLTSDTS